MDGLTLINRLEGGFLLDRLQEQLADTATAVAELDASGTVTATFKITKLAKGGDLAVSIDVQISSRPPRRKPTGAILYVQDGVFHREDPRQIRMELREVTNELTGEMRQVEISPPIAKEV